MRFWKRLDNNTLLIFYFTVFCFTKISANDEGLIPAFGSEDKQSIMDISGRKLIRFSLSEQKFSSPYESNKYGFQIDQELQIRVHGVARRKLHFDIDYDDTREDKNKNRVSAIYVGDDDEIVQRAAFGYVPLGISGPELIAYNKTTFGVCLETQFDAEKTFGGRKDYIGINYPDHTPPPIYPNLKVKALATFSEAQSERKEFSGTSTKIERDIKDVEYVKSRYYRVYDSKDELPVANVKIYLDDKNSSNNFSGDEWTELQSGSEYAMNENTGEISFFTSIKENYVIAVSYDDSSGKRHERKIIKDENDTEYFWRYKVRNVYFLGSKNIDPKSFSIKITDVFGKECTDNFGIDSKFIDYDYGLLVFPDDLPFQNLNPSVYTKSPVSKFIIHVSYQASANEYFLRSGIIAGSEKVYLDGKVLKKGVDYNIDYDIGQLSFLVEIEEDAKIVVDYEYFPFGKGTQSTITGLRAEYEPAPNFGIGATYMAEDKESSSKDVVLGTDARMEFEVEDIQINISGEIAKSSVDPNTNNKLSINNIEDDKVSDQIMTDIENWSVVSSNPLGEISRGGLLEVKEVDVSHLFLRNQSSGWAGIMSYFSKRTLDFSKREYIEVWVKSATKSGALNIDIGDMNEDVDNDGILDTEDKDGDGKLGKDEDTGFYCYDELVGSSNKKLDTEDLDGDGFLETNDNYFNFKLDLEDFPNSVNPEWIGRSENGWTLLNIPLASASRVGSADWEVVKYIRLWINGLGDVTIDALQIVGRGWDTPENERFDVRLNNEGEAGIIPHTNYSLMMVYSLRAMEEGWTQWNFSEPFGFSDYRILHFWLKQDVGQTAADEVFFIQLGVDENNYYEWTTPVKDIPTNWDNDGIDILLSDEDGNRIPDGLKRVGNLVSLYRIKFIRVGIRNFESDVSDERKIYLDEIMLKERIKKRGEARKVSVRAEIEDRMDVSLDYWQWCQGFKTIGRDIESQDRDLMRVVSNITYLKFLPITLNLEKENKSPREDKYGVMSPEEINEEKVSKEGVNAILQLPHNPKFLSFNYQDNDTKVLSLQRKINRDIYTYGFEYNVPRVSLVDRLKFDLGLKRSRETQDYELEGFSRFCNSDTRSVGIGYSPVRYFDMDYSWRRDREVNEKSDWHPLSRDQWAGIDVEPFRSMNGLRNEVKSSVDYKERFLTGDESGLKDANVAGEAEWQVDARPNKWWDINPLLFSQTIRARKSAIFDNVSNEVGFSTFVKKIRDGAITGQDLSTKEINSQNYYAFRSRYNLSSSLVLNAGYNLEREKQTIFESIFKTRTRISSVGMDCRVTERADLNMDYAHKRILKEDISEKTVSSPSFSLLTGWTRRFSSRHSFSFRNEKENVYRETRIKKLRVYEPDMEFTYKFGLPMIANRARWVTGVRAELISTKDYFEYDSSRRYNLRTKFDYDVTEFLSFDLAFNYEIFKNKSQLEKDYRLFKASSKCVITF